MIEQGSFGWLRQRLGNFTGSRIGDLMTSGKKGELFGKTAFSYIYEVAAERNLLPKYIEDDYLFEIYQNQVSINNKFIEFGHENEDFAAERYSLSQDANLRSAKVYSTLQYLTSPLLPTV